MPVFMAGTRRSRLGENGFTLIETISVLVILTIVAVVALVRIPSLAEHTKEMETNTLKSHLRYVQARAMGSESVWSIEFIAPDTYRFLKDAAASGLVPPGADITDAQLNPDNDPFTVNLVGLKAVVPSGNGHDNRINFDKTGSPVKNDGTRLAADISIKDDDGAGLFSVTAHTGFIE